MLFVGIGVMLTLLLDISQRDKESPRTPRRWSWPFFWRDNMLRFILNLLVAVALIRFWPDIKGEEISMFYCFCTGLCFDSLYIAVRAVRKRWKMDN
ncbi:MAG: hypothetical protein LBQ60_13700 [Bacteroidales bacterium]|nr:hypothetical protein [Bacteroidales bacterium]